MAVLTENKAKSASFEIGIEIEWRLCLAIKLNWINWGIAPYHYFYRLVVSESANMASIELNWHWIVAELGKSFPKKLEDLCSNGQKFDFLAIRTNVLTPSVVLSLCFYESVPPTLSFSSTVYFPSLHDCPTVFVFLRLCFFPSVSVSVSQSLFTVFVSLYLSLCLCLTGVT